MSTTAPAAPPTGGFPFYYGLVVDKLIVALQVAFWWIALVPLILWAFLRTLLLYALMFGLLIVPIVLTTAFGAALFLIAIYWTPSISIALVQMAPLMAALLELGAFALSIGWFIMIVLIDLWNILIPLFVVFFIYFVHFLLTVITLIVRQLTSTDLTALFESLIEVGFFFADLIVITLTVIVSVLPAALTITITIARPLLLLLFRVIIFLFPAIQFLLLTLFQLLPAVFFSVLKLVRVFRSLLRSDTAFDTDIASSSPRYQAGQDAFFNALVSAGQERDWEAGLNELDVILRGQANMPDYSHLPDPLANAADRRKRRSLDSGDDDYLPTSRGSLHKRWRGDKDIESSSRERGVPHDADREWAQRSDTAHVAGTALLDGFHSVLDTAAPLHVHQRLFNDAADRLVGVFSGFKTARQALDHYNQNYGHPALWLAHHAPDLFGTPLGRAIRESNPDDEYNAGWTHHEWRRAGYPPVDSDHPRADEINRALIEHRQAIVTYNRKRAAEVNRTVTRLDFSPVQTPDIGLPSGQVPLPFEVQVVIGSNCFARPKFILCLPRPKPRRFTAPELLIPTNLPDASTCPGFIAPPNPADGLDKVLIEMFNPWIALRNSWTYFRYVLSAFANVFYSINEQTISNPWLYWFFDLLALNDISEEPLTLEDLICLIPFSWYPFYIITIALGAIAIALPLIWLVFSLISYLLMPFQKTWAAVHGLLMYYDTTGTRVRVLEPRRIDDIAQQKWWRERAALREGYGRGELQRGVGNRDVAGMAERAHSRPYTEDRIAGELDQMGPDEAHRLFQMEQEALLSERLRDQARDQVHRMNQHMHRIGALTPHAHIGVAGSSRVHMSRTMRQCALPPHTSTLADAADRMRNLQVALGHRPLSDSVPVTEMWE